MGCTVFNPPLSESSPRTIIESVLHAKWPGTRRSEEGQMIELTRLHSTIGYR